MGNTKTKCFLPYSIFLDDEKPGETATLRHPIYANHPLQEVNQYGTRTTWECLNDKIKKGMGKKPLCGYRKRIEKDKYEEKFTWVSYEEALEKVIAFAKGATLLDFSPNFHSDRDGDFKFIGIYSRNRIEWVLGYLGAHAYSATIVTIYDTLGDIAIEFIIGQTQLKTIIIESNVLAKMTKIIKEGKANTVKNLIVVNGEDDPESMEELKKLGINLFTFEEVCDKGRKEGTDDMIIPPKPDDICTICYTSGTTGYPKGAMVSHGALLVTSDVMGHTGFLWQEEEVYLSYLPYAHIMETLIMAVLISGGKPFGIYSGNAAKLIEDAKILKPTLMCAVPRIFQRIYEAIHANIKKLNYIKKNLVTTAINQKLSNFNQYGVLKHVIWDPLVLKPIREILGGRLRFMLVGSAPMDPEVMNFLRVALSSEIVEGYGQTENCAGMVISHSWDNVCGHIGGPGYCNEIKLKDVPDLDYHSTDKDPETGAWRPRGEICVRGPALFKGYLNDEENTNLAVDKEGWFHSGDVGMILPEHGNAIKIIDRVKNIFKLQQGEYVAPEKLENILEKCKYVEQVFVYGDSLKNYLVAVVVPREKETIEFLKSIGKDVNKDNYKDYFDDEVLKKEILKEMETLGRKNDFKGFEVIKKVHLSKIPFSVDNDMATPTMKIKRPNAKKYYKKILDDLYNQ